MCTLRQKAHVAELIAFVEQTAATDMPTDGVSLQVTGTPRTRPRKKNAHEGALPIVRVCFDSARSPANLPRRCADRPERRPARLSWLVLDRLFLDFLPASLDVPSRALDRITRGERQRVDCGKAEH